MAVIKLSDIQLVYDGDTLTISSVKTPEKSVTLDAQSVEELVDFVQGLAPVDESDGPGSNRRESFRVPVLDDSGLAVTLVKGNKRCEAKPANISMTGVFIKVPEKSQPDFKISDEIFVELTYQKSKIELEAIVRRIEDGGIGLFFPVTIKSEHVNPPPLVRRIVMDLQRQWMLHTRDS
ncbi:MAG: PilZ domain-containing protein [Planctomycetales bacterium]|nr:PilZ domain-containing protein [Planctomycetales bacterium]